MITGKTAIYALFGAPVAQSLSPVMHMGWMADHGLDAAYIALPIDEREATEALRAVHALGFAGANITSPFKEIVPRIAAGCTPAVERLEAANVLARTESGMMAHNTDAGGFVGALDETTPDWRSTVKTALVLGASGAARAIGYGLQEAGVEKLLIANRTQSKADDARRLLGAPEKITVVPWEALPEAFAVADLIVNATKLGMGGSEVAWPLDRAPDHAIVADAVYAPLDTGLLRQARARALVAVDGLGMLIHQGALAFELWFGVRPDVAAARQRLLRHLQR